MPTSGQPRTYAGRGRAARVATASVLTALVATALVVLTPAVASADTQTVTNSTSVAVPAGGTGAPAHSPASVYPLPITISGMASTVTKVTVRLNNLTHQLGRDVDVLLVGPQGQSVVVLSDAGSNATVTNQSPTFDDTASGPVPESSGGASGIGSGTYQPTNVNAGFTGDEYPAPAPAGPYGSSFAVFNGTNPNGVWNLYVVDDANGDAGTLAGGWTLTVETGVATFPGQLQLSSTEYRATEGGGSAVVTVSRVSGDDGAVGVTLATGNGSATAGADYTPVSTTVSFADGETTKTVNVPIAQDPTVEGVDELVPLTLSNPTGGATLGSPATGQIRIQDDDARRNTFPITMPAPGTPNGIGAAYPYPSNVVVSGGSGVVTDVNVTVDNLSHTAPFDVALLLVAPNGASTLLMSDAGSGVIPVTDIDLTFDDEAGAQLPASGAITGGTFRPTDDDLDDDGVDSFPAPAPAGPWGSTLAALDGASPNGTWSLYVYDDAGGDVGDIDSGWSLDLTTATASAGGPYSTPEGSSVTLTGSTTPSLDGATYTWDLNGDGTYGDATGANPTVTAGTLASLGLGDGPITRSARVRATSGAAVITSTATNLAITNAAPTGTLANNGPVVVDNPAQVSFSGVSDPSTADAAALRYAFDYENDGTWEVGDGTYAGGVTSSSANVPASVLDEVGSVTVAGRVIDKDGAQTTYTTQITVEPPPNVPPVADAGPDQVVNSGSTVTLDGRGSSDADSDPLSYSWVQTAGPAVTLTGATVAQPTFTAPAAGSVLTFQVTVDDGEDSDTDSVTVTVNRPPVADAGDDPTVQEGAQVELDGTDSGDADSDDLTYAWTQTAGPTVVVGDATTATPSFTAPTGPATLTFELEVTDELGLTATDTVTITVNAAPTADAGDDQLVDEGEPVALDGTGSTDPENASLAYTWLQTGGPAVVLTGVASDAPSFTAPSGPATLVFQVTVDDGHGAQDTDTVTVIVNGPPDADAGDDQQVVEGDTVTLDGRGSSDPENGALDHAWVQTAGAAVVLTGADTDEPSFTAPASGGTLIFELTVTDDRGRTDTDTVEVVVDRIPTADAGADQEVNGGSTVDLDGRGSTDTDGDPLSHDWVQTAGPAVILSGANTAQPSFTAPVGPAALTFQLTVADGRGGSDTDTVVVTVNGAPSAHAGDDEEVNAGAVVSLDGSGSSDPDGDTLTYSWAQTGGPAVVLNAVGSAQPSFTAPTGPATLTFQLTVQDPGGEADTDTVEVTVNGVPTGDAGPDEDVNGGDTVSLDGRGSSDPDGDSLAYSWSQTAGSAVTMTGADTAQPSFTAPTGPATLTFELTVQDPGGETDTDTVTITVNGLPVARAGADQGVRGGAVVTLDGSASSDPDGDPLDHAWTQISGPAVVLTGAGSATPSFTAPGTGDTLTFELAVDDGRGGTSTDTVTVTVDAQPPTVELSAPVGPHPGTFTVGLAFSEPVTGLTAGDVQVTNGSAASMAGSGAAYTVMITPAGDGQVTVQLPAGAVEDAAGNPSTVSPLLTRMADLTRPTVVLGSATPMPTSASSVPVTIVFSEPVSGFTLSDLSVTGGTLGDLSGTGSTYAATLSFDPTGTGATVTLAGGAAVDAAGNASQSAAPLVLEYDGRGPDASVTAAPGQDDPVRGPVVRFVVTASEPVGDLAASDVTVVGNTGADAVGVARTGPQSFELSVSGMTSTGEVGVRLATGAFADALGNGSPAVESPLVAWARTKEPALTVTRDHSCQSDGGAGVGLRLAPNLPATFALESSDGSVLRESGMQLTGTADDDPALRLLLDPRGSGVARVTVTATNHGGTSRLVLRLHVGNNQSDRFRGSDQTDVVLGRHGADSITGGEGRDLLCGGGGDDRIEGEAGDDVLHGEGGDDRLEGGGGDDVLVGGPGTDRLVGGGGRNDLSQRGSWLKRP